MKSVRVIRIEIHRDPCFGQRIVKTVDPLVRSAQLVMRPGRRFVTFDRPPSSLHRLSGGRRSVLGNFDENVLIVRHGKPGMSVRVVGPDGDGAQEQLTRFCVTFSRSLANRRHTAQTQIPGVKVLRLLVDRALELGPGQFRRD